jgi:nucleoside-diphosphate-sugar epimerase
VTRPVVLVTGLSGLIGGAFLAREGGAYDVRGLNRRPVAGVVTHQADVADLDALAPAFAGVDVVVHLAAAVGADMPFDVLLRHNIAGTYNVFECARRAGVRRVVFASSGNTVTALEREMPYRALADGRYDELAGQSWERIAPTALGRPGSLYGCTKLWGETLGRFYADVHGLSVICLRIGHVSAADRPEEPREFGVWCSQRDVARGIALAIDVPPSVRYDVLFITSDNAGATAISPACARSSVTCPRITPKTTAEGRQRRRAPRVLREDLRERQGDVGKGLKGHRRVTGDVADVPIAARVGRTMDLDTLRDAVDHPVLGNTGRGVEPELGRAVVGEGAVGHLDEQERIVRVGFAFFIGHRAEAENREIGLGLGVVGEGDGVLDGHDGAPDQADHQQLVQVVDERAVPSTDGRHLDDLAADQLDPIGPLEDPNLAHPVVLLAGK